MLEMFETVARAVADHDRARILKLLEGGEISLCQLATVLDLPSSAVAGQLDCLKSAGLVRYRREGSALFCRLDSDGPDADVRRFLDLLRDSLDDDPVVAGDRRLLGLVNAVPVSMVCRRECTGRTDATEPVNILFLCTGNSARSVFAECLMNRLGRGRWRAFSAGSRPAGRINPLTLTVLRENGFAAEGLRSKSWDEFAQTGAPCMNLVVTVCDSAAGEVCPVWPGHPAKLHLGFPDPTAAKGSDAERLTAFRDVYDRIEAKLKRLVALGPEGAGGLQ